MDPVVSWTVFLTGGAALYWYYRNSNDKKKQARAGRAKSVSEEPAPQAKSKRKTETATSGSDTATKKKGDVKARNKKQTPSKTPEIIAQPVFDEKEEDDNKEWAKQLAELKKGTTLAPPTRQEGRGKTVKQRAADVDRGITSGSSTNGADADGELSPALSPAIPPSGRDVADMLEAPAAGPSVLRLTESTKPAKQQQPKKAPAQDKETKKQRQNRRKKEEERAAREDAEKARKVLLEKQLRTARESRGEPAKNGLTSASNAWTEKQTTTAAGPSADAPLLDTLDHDQVSTGSSAANTNDTSATSVGNVWERELPSEEEQLRLAMEDSGWNTVEKAKKGKKKSSDKETEPLAVKQVSEVPAESIAETPKSSSKSSPKDSPKVKPADSKALNSFVALDETSTFSTGTGHPQDSDWAVV